MRLNALGASRHEERPIVAEAPVEGVLVGFFEPRDQPAHSGIVCGYRGSREEYERDSLQRIAEMGDTFGRERGKRHDHEHGVSGVVEQIELPIELVIGRTQPRSERLTNLPDEKLIARK